MQRFICALAAATIVTEVSASVHPNFWRTLMRGPAHWNVPNVREAAKGKESKQYYLGTTEDIVAVIEVSRAGSAFWNSEFFWQGFLANMQVDVTNYASQCIGELTTYYYIFRETQYNFASRLAYSNGRDDKGNGESTAAGYYMDMVTSYLDIVVELTNLWNYCELDYIWQAFGMLSTSLSGFLGFSTSLLTVAIMQDQVSNYKGMSAAAYNSDPAAAGQYLGLWFKALMGVELQDAQILEDTVVIGTISSGSSI